MDRAASSDNEYIPASGAESDDRVFTLSGGGMFAGSQNFVVAGGTFTNLTNNYVAAPVVPPNFRMIPIGDIDLQHELVVNEISGVVDRRFQRNSVRRVYSAAIEGRNSNVTVAVYQGDGAEEDWRRDTEVYMSVRHPSIIQIWAGASYENIHATVFHGDLVPVKAFLAPQSTIIMVYSILCYEEEWRRVKHYFKSLGQGHLPSWECTMWIRTSTGRLSVDPVAPDAETEFVLDTDYPKTSPVRQTATHDRPCYQYLTQDRDGSISTSATVNIGAVIFWPAEHEYDEHVEIALSPDVYVGCDGWRSGKALERAENGWSRYRTDDVFNTEIKLPVYSDPAGWWSQANYVFSRLQITSNLEDYVLLRYISFILTIGDAVEDPPPGYLFLCPKEDFQTGPTSFTWPKIPAYWSLDPQGVDVLSTEEAARLGFPSFQQTTIVHGRSCDASVYPSLCKFHQAKGFNPESQDVALHLGHALYKLSGDLIPPFAHSESATPGQPLS
ncbi:hypothetical protein C8F04DRAFT_1043024 [Mycena alexandri]|uniref:Uncharacterized protein n=1 Tax=Mycena alexandri TaxID=1745969 RepID=A0AAD6X054_9AGAR|nr:hypothetical protein C8F04DRAFT_1043024 [Mycena alexandri]